MTQRLNQNFIPSLNHDLNEGKRAPRSLVVHSRRILFLGLSFLSFFSFAESDRSLILCKQDKMARTLRITTLQDKRCQAIYTKQGIDQVIGSSQNLEACSHFIGGVRKKLAQAHWQCRDVKAQSEVTTLDGGSSQ